MQKTKNKSARVPAFHIPLLAQDRQDERRVENTQNCQISIGGEKMQTTKTKKQKSESGCLPSTYLSLPGTDKITRELQNVKIKQS